MSTGMYELYKSGIIAFYEKRAADDNCNLIIKFSNTFDKSKVCVETHIKVHPKTPKACSQSKFTLNLYHTQSRIMANGKNTDLFLKDHGDVVGMLLSSTEVKALDQKIYKAIAAELRKITPGPQDTVDVPPVSNNLKKLTYSHREYETTSAPDREEMDEEGSIAEALDYCPWCKEKVGDSQGGICCENCLQWFHFTCEGTSEEDSENSDPDQPYFCKTCQPDCRSLQNDFIIQEGVRSDEATQNVQTNEEPEQGKPTHVCCRRSQFSSKMLRTLLYLTRRASVVAFPLRDPGQLLVLKRRNPTKTVLHWFPLLMVTSLW